MHGNRESAALQHDLNQEGGQRGPPFLRSSLPQQLIPSNVSKSNCSCASPSSSPLSATQSPASRARLTDRGFRAGLKTHGRSYRWLDHPFGLGRSRRISLNSPGALKEALFPASRASSGADGSINLSICCAAMSEAFRAAFGLRRGIGCASVLALKPIWASRRIAAGRDVGASCFSRQLSTAAKKSPWQRTPTVWPRPVAGRPRRLPSIFC